MLHRLSSHVIRSLVSIVTILTLLATPALRYQTANAAGSQHIVAFPRENWVELVDFPADTDVDLTVLIPAQAPYHTTVHTDPNGYYREQFQGVGAPLLAEGMTIQATVPGSDPLVQKELVLAPFSIDAIDYAGRSIEGSGPDSASIHVYLNRPASSDDLPVTLQSGGAWSLSVPAETGFAAGAQQISAQAFDGDGDALQTDLRLPQMAVGLLSDWIYLFNYPSNDTVTVTIESGAEIFNQTFQVDEAGFLEILPTEHQQDLIPGMTVTALGTAYPVQKSVTLPEVAITAVDNVTKTVSGTAVGDLALVVSVNYSDVDRVSLPVTATAGAWSVDFSAFESADRVFNWPDGIDVYVEYYNNDADWVYARMPKPANVNASPVNEWIQGQNFDWGSGVSLTIKDSSDQIVFGPQNFPVEPWGEFYIDGRSQGDGFNLEPGMVVSVDGGSAGTKELTLQALTLDSADLETGEVRGTAPGGSLVKVMAGNEQGGKQVDTTAAAAGDWLVDFTPGADDFELLANMHFEAAVSNADGDHTFAELTWAHMDVWPDDNKVSAYDFPAGQMVNLTVLSPEGQTYYSASQMPQENWDNPSLGSTEFYLEGEYALTPGQKVILQSGNIIRRTVIQNLGSVEVDLIADTITGTAAPGALIWGCVFTENGCVLREATTGQDGVFTLDYSGGDAPYDLKPGNEGVVNWSDGQGNNTSHFWRMWQGFLAANVQNRWINFRDWPRFETVTLKINGTEFGSAVVDQNPWNPGDPNDILALFENVNFQAGDQLQIFDDTSALIRSLTVGAIEVVGVDLAAERISGTATSGASVAVCVNTDHGCEFRSGQAADGNWMVDFSTADPEQGQSPVDLVPGVNGWAAVFDDDGDQTTTDWHIQEPNITANVENSWVQSRNWPTGTQVRLTVAGTLVGTEEAVPDDWNPEDIRAFFEEVTMQAGQTVTVSNLDGSITQSLQLANLAIDQIDQDNATIRGTTDPNLRLEVCINTNEGCLIRNVQADGSGNWTADFATAGSVNGDIGQIDSITPGSNGWVAANEVNGPDRTWLDWSLPGLPAFQASLTNNWINGWNFSPNISNLTVTLKDQSNEVVFSSSSMAVDNGGNFWIDGNILNVDLLPGMTVSVIDPTLGEKTLILLPLSLDTADLETDVVTGTAPAGSMLTVNAGNEFGGKEVTVTANEQGAWSADFAAAEFDLLPRMGFNVALPDEDGDRTVAELTNAHINVALDENRVSGYEWEVGLGNQVTLVLQDSEGVTLHTDQKVVQADDQGRGLGYVDFGVPAGIPLQPGQRVTLTSGNVVRRTTIADLPAPTVDQAASRLTVEFPFAGASIWACVDSPEGCIFRSASYDEASGTYVIDYLTAGQGETPYQLQPGDQGDINLDDGLGSRTSRRWNIWNPNITASVAGQWVHTREWAPGTQVYLHINGGEPIGPVTVQAAEWDERDMVGVFQLEEGTLAVGDVLNVTDGTIAKLLTLVDLSVDWSDRANAVLRGSTAAGMLVEVGINRDESEGGLLLRRVNADADSGDWSADFSVPGALPDEGTTAESIWDGAYGWVTAIDEDGDRTHLDWSIPNPHMDVWINANFVSVYDWPAGSELTLTVAEGETELYSTTITTQNSGEEIQGSADHPLAAGQTVTVSGGGFERSLTLADLQPPIVDVAGSTLSGQAPAGAFIWACVFGGEQGCVWRGIEVGADGHYLLDFDQGGPGEATHVFQPGDHGGINWAGEQGSNTSRFWSVGNFTLLAIPAEQQIAGLDWPEGATVNVTVTDPQTSASKSGTAVVAGEETCGSGTCFIWEPNDWTLAAGQVVTAAYGGVTKTITISALQITRVDVLHDQLAGTANPNQEVTVSVISQSWVSRTTTADGDGYWMVDFSVPGTGDETATADLTVPDNGIVQQVDPAGQTGDGTLENWSAEAPIGLSQDHLDENVPAGATVGALAPVYDLAGQTLTYSLVAGDGSANNDAFSIDGNALKINASPNFEILPAYSIRIRVEDSSAAGKSFEIPLTITVNDLNDAPTAIDLSAASVLEGAGPGTIVGTLSATDEDRPAQGMTFSLVAGYADNAAFAITGDQLSINQPPDYETLPGYAIKVRVTDSQGGTFDRVFTIAVENAAEAPTDILLSGASVDENTPVNTVIGTFSVTGADQGQTFTYSLVSGSGSTDNAAFTIDGSSLKLNASPDFENKPVLAIRVRAADSQDGSLTFEKELTVTVNNLNEAPTALNLSAASLDENAPAGSAVGAFSASDPDTGQAFNYSLVSGSGDTDNSAFTVTGASLTLNASPNYEDQSSYSIRVRVSDNGSPAEYLDKVFTITINNLNEAPETLNLSASSLDENAAAGSLVGHFSASDPEGAQAFSYSLVSGSGDTNNAAFTISGTALTINSAPDFETQDSYEIRVRVSDDGDPALTLEKNFTITVLDLNEPATAIELTDAAIAENSPAGTAVGTLAATDPDTGQSFTYSLVSGTGSADNAVFAISGSTLTITVAPDYETKASYAIRVRAADNGSPSRWFEQPLTVTVENVAEAPVVVTFNKTGVQDNPIAFSSADFSTHFIDPDSAGPGALQSIKISQLPSLGILQVNGGPALAADAEILSADLNQLVYQPEDGYSGSDSFAWNGSDGVSYAASPAQVGLTVGFVARYGVQVSPAGDAKSIKAEASRAVVAGYSLTITNTGNTADSYRVTLVGIPAWGTSISPTAVASLAAGGQGNVSVQVTVPAGASGSQVSTLKITSESDPAAAVTVALTTTASAPPPPSPVLLSVAPASAHATALATAKVTLSGANFSDPMTVKIGGVGSASVVRNSSAELVAAVPAALTPGVYTVQVCNAAMKCASLPNAFTVLNNDPVISAVYPAQGYNDAPNTILVRGFNLSASTTLALPGAAADKQPTGVRVSGSQLQATIPAGLPAGAYDLLACNGSACDTLEGAYAALDVVQNDFSASNEDLWTAPVTIRAGNTVVLGLNVHRLSGIGLASAPVAFYLNDPGNPANKISPVLDPQTAELPSGSVDVVTALWTPPAELSGTVRIYAVIDPQGVLTEATRANNIVSTTIQILPRQEEDETAPVIAGLLVNGGEAVTGQRQVNLTLTASDPAGGAGLKTMKVVERQYNTSARQWVVAQETGWIAYQASYALNLTGGAGLHYVQVWVADGAGNTSEMVQASINYAPAQDSLSAGQVHIYRLSLTAGAQETYSLQSLAGDADLYVWDEQGNLVASSLETGPVDTVAFTAGASGIYQVEVYGYTDATYAIDFTAALPEMDGLTAVRIQSDPPAKPARSQPSIVTQNEPMKTNPSGSAPIDAQTEGSMVYLPLVIR